LWVWSLIEHNSTWIIEGTTATVPLPYPLDYYDDTAWTVTLWGDEAWIGRKDSEGSGYYDTANVIDRNATVVTFTTCVLRYIGAGVFTNVSSVSAPIASVPPYITTLNGLNAWLNEQQQILTNAVVSNLRAVDIGAITSEEDAIAITALEQYAATNKVVRWQDSADPSILLF